MIYTTFQDKKLSMLGFGTMRLPQLPDNTIDQPQLQQMVNYALANGVNYFDTAYAYHKGFSETAIGQALSAHPRSSYYLASKYPGHQIASTYNPAAVFEEQLQKCRVDYFDFYLLHNVYEKSADVYLDPQWGIIDYFKEQRRLGRIKHLGFSTHAQPDTLRKFLDIFGDDMEFCQIQLNYVDWELQNAKEKYEMLCERNMPIWVMEPVRGGHLAKLNDEQAAKLEALRPGAAPADWCFYYLQSLPGVSVVLSGMSSMEQMQANVRTFEKSVPLSPAELECLLQVGGELSRGVPCTACRYCCQSCPQQLDIPRLLGIYNDICFAPEVSVRMLIEAMPQEKQPSACIGCGSCSAMCPQNIDIPAEMKNMTAALDKIPSWEEVCRQRDEAARAAQNA